MGDVVLGIVEFPAIHVYSGFADTGGAYASGPADGYGQVNAVDGNSIKTLGLMSDPATSTSLGSGTGNSELTAVYGFTIAAAVPNVFGGTTYVQHPLDTIGFGTLGTGTPWPWPAAHVGGGAYANPGPDGSMVNIYEGTVSGGTVNFTSSLSGPVGPVTSASDGTLVGTAGIFQGPALLTGLANGDGEYFITSAPFPRLPANLFEFNLTLAPTDSSPLEGTLGNDIAGPGGTANVVFPLPGPGLPFTYPATRDQKLYGFGNFQFPVVGWSATSNGDFVFLHTHTPGAACAGLIAFGILGMSRRRKHDVVEAAPDGRAVA